MDKKKMIKMLNDCIEWAELTCDEITVGEFFEMIDLRNQSSEYCLMVKELSEEGIFDEE
jgi:hypothetical protein